MSTTKVRVKERVVAPAPVVAPTRQNTYAPANVYAGANTYAPANVYAAVNTYGGDGPGGKGPGGGRQNRYGGDGENNYGKKKKLVHRTIVVIQPFRARGDLLWIPASEFEMCFENQSSESTWELGSYIDFDDAAMSMSWQEGGCYGRCQLTGEPLEDDAECDPEDESHLRVHRLTAGSVESARTTHQSDRWWDSGDVDVNEVALMGLQLRAELLDDPAGAVARLAAVDLTAIAAWAGLTHTPLHPEVLAAVRTDTQRGLGAAALDFVVWQLTEQLGPAGVALAEILQEANRESYIRRLPVDNFLLSTGALHPDTEIEVEPRGPRATLAGSYTPTRVEYQHDPNGTVLCGWRDVYIEPVSSISGYPQ